MLDMHAGHVAANPLPNYEVCVKYRTLDVNPLHRRRSSVRSPKAYTLGGPQMVGISTLEGLQVFLDEKQREMINAHSRRTKELETTLVKEETYFGALLE